MSPRLNSGLQNNEMQLTQRDILQDAIQIGHHH